ncbi:acetoin utilization protein AcuC [Effusibacillus dendaii]|uniref:Acetoin utilization protein AcuC n=1 Tax=Effusibacillus dendaii TaxID=2743772 RepID=A0A7I8DGK9_9BACL|nr:acetoin utilization protein AcuC [Effusibacillus dendaii]BCJ88482.1 acetoin utilization protein AcuC [Effusibacillus dendaii]
MMDRTAFIYSDAFLAYKFGEEHPFNPKRVELTVDLIRELGLLQQKHIFQPRPATLEELFRVHDPNFVHAVQKAGKLPPGQDGSDIGFGLGTEDTPIFPNMHEATSLVVGGTVVAADLVMSGKVNHALNLAGGLHHARRSEASGFCVYNDIGAAIAYIKDRYHARVLYIDTDAHHGDGVQWMFYDDPDVLTVSFHETGKYLYPGTGDIEERGTGRGYGYSLNIPLEPFTEDESWLTTFESIIPHLFHKFRPDVVISQNGCDAHHFDPLTHLSATTRIYRDIPKMVHQLAHEVCEGRWIAVGGGGYDIWRVVPRAWTMLWAELSEQTLPDEIPQTWIDKWQPQAPVTLPTSFLDPPDLFPPIPRRAEIEEKNRITVRRSLFGAPFLL